MSTVDALLAVAGLTTDDAAAAFGGDTADWEVWADGLDDPPGHVIEVLWQAVGEVGELMDVMIDRTRALIEEFMPSELLFEDHDEGAAIESGFLSRRSYRMICAHVAMEFDLPFGFGVGVAS